jgi:hypothetical protein
VTGCGKRGQVQLHTMDWTVLLIVVVAATGAYIAGRGHEHGRLLDKLVLRPRWLRPDLTRT